MMASTLRIKKKALESSAGRMEDATEVNGKMVSKTAEEFTVTRKGLKETELG